MRRTAGRLATLGAAAGAYAVVLWRGHTYGSTPAERTAEMPGDDLVPDAQLTITHAIDLAAPPERVWPWLLQVGWGRGGWYTPRWVDRLLFPANGPSATAILPEHQHLEVGDRIPDGPPATRCWFTVADLDPGRLLVLRSDSHLPLSWRERGVAGVDWTWVFALRPRAGGTRTRLVFRWRSRTWPWWLTAGVRSVVVPADYLMSRGMLRGLRERTAR